MPIHKPSYSARTATVYSGKIVSAHSASKAYWHPIFSINQLELSLYHDGTFKHSNISFFFSFLFFFLVPIRSCREFAERCNSKTDGLYTIFLQKPNAAETVKVFCDMTHDGGGWTLLVTSASNKGWTKDNVKSR